MATKTKKVTMKALNHERAVIVDGTMRGFAFGKNPITGDIIVCVPKQEFQRLGLECVGPCINKFYDASRVKNLDVDFIEIEYGGESDEGEEVHDGNGPSTLS